MLAYGSCPLIALLLLILNVTLDVPYLVFDRLNVCHVDDWAGVWSTVLMVVELRVIIDPKVALKESRRT